MSTTVKLIKQSVFIALLLVVFVMTGCDHKGEKIPTSYPTITSLQNDGWAFFAKAQYDLAIASFDEARNRDAANVDAYNGLGWSYTRVAQYNLAQSNFNLLLSLTDDVNFRADALAGLAMMYFATPRDLSDPGKIAQRDARDSTTIAYVHQVLDLNPNYVFSHDQNINAKMLHKVIAQCIFNQRKYLKTIQKIEKDIVPNYFQSLIDKELVKKVEKDTAKAALLSNSSIDGKALLSILRPVARNGKTERVAVDLVDVATVTNLLQNVNYKVAEFVEGGNSVTIQGNPLPQKEEKFLVDYYFAPDYGKMLADIMQVLHSQ